MDGQKRTGGKATVSQTDREACSRLLEEVRAGRTDTMVVPSFDAFENGILEAGYYAKLVFPYLHVRLVSVREAFDSARTEDRGWLNRQIQEMLRERVSEKASRQKIQYFETHMRQGDLKLAKAPYGYRIDEERNVFTVDTETAPVVRLIFDWYLHEKKVGMIADFLNLLMIRTPGEYKKFFQGQPEAEKDAWKAKTEREEAGCGQKTGEGPVEREQTRDVWKWTGDRIRAILANEVYTGSRIHGKRRVSRKNGGETRRMNREEWLVHEDCHEAIVTADEFARVQERMKAEGRGKE